MIKLVVLPTFFTPAEAAGITGVSPELQRDWRRRGLLPKPGQGHARLDAFDLARLTAIRELSFFNAGPSYARDRAESVFRTIVYFAVLDRGALEFVDEPDLKFQHDDAPDIAKSVSEMRDSENAVYSVWLRDGTQLLVGNLDEVFFESQYESGLFLNLKTCGLAISQAAARPLFRVRRR